MAVEVRLDRIGRTMIVEEEVAPILSALAGLVILNKRGYPFIVPSLGRLFYALYHGSVPNDAVVDHKDRNPFNNSKDNLRLCTWSQNAANRICRRKSPFRGIWQKSTSGRWTAVIRHGGKNVTLGTFDTPAEAARCYDAVARHLHGDCAVTNFAGTDMLSVDEARRIAASKMSGKNRRTGKGYWRRGNHYLAKLSINGRVRCLGLFATEAEASAAYQKAKAEYLAGMPIEVATRKVA